MIKGENIYFRAIEQCDKKFMFDIENNSEFWCLSNTLAPYSEEQIENFIGRASTLLIEEKQMRFVICKILDNEAIGFIDIFDYDNINLRAGVGIIVSKEFRNCGFGSEAVNLLCDYAKRILRLHQLWACVLKLNEKSISIFKNNDFVFCGEKRDWVWVNDNYENELIFQKIL